ncbi:MAG: MFS transporter, partial [Dehalococcoidia bacterium]
MARITPPPEDRADERAWAGLSRAARRPSHEPLVTGPPIWGIPYRYIALAVVCLGLFTLMMDMPATAIALPTLAEAFDTSDDTVLWAVLVNPVIVITLSLMLGRFGDLYGRKRFFGAGFVFFTVGMGLAAIAGSFAELVGARLIQSGGMALIMANVAAIVAASFPAASRAQALGLMTATIGAGWASGPLLGGLAIDLLDWRAIYWARVPLGVVGVLLIWRVLRDTPRDLRPQGLDLPGALTLSAALFTFVLALNRAQAWGWTSIAIVALFATSVISLAAFIHIERRSASPVVALDLFRSRAFSGGAIAAVLLYYGVTGAFVILPFFLIEARGLGTLEAGAVLATLPFAMAVTAPLSGWLADRTGPRHWMGLGLLAAAAGM